VRHSGTPTAVSVRLLGTVAVATGGDWLPVSGRRRSAVLAALALQPGDAVSVDRLADVVWGDRPPRTAGDTLRSHLSYLRRILPEAATVVARPAGYVLELGGSGVDARAAEVLVAQAVRSVDARQRQARLRAAIAMWQGPPLADLTGLLWFDGQAARLRRLLLQARRLLIDARLELGEHQHLVSELEEVTREHPLDEQFHGQLMTALYRSGRPADALAVYQRLRDSLDEQLGVLPDVALRDLHTAILRQDPSLAPSTPAAAPLVISPSATTPTAAVPAQLPATTAAFVAREREQALLDNILDGLPIDAVSAIVVVCGTAGVGKTTLANHWAHQVRSRFPDGQLYVDLRGYDPTGPVMDPGEAVRGFLEAFGVSGEQLPPSWQGQLSLYRSILSGKRVLILADNARDEQQIRPLLPGGPGSLLLVTSRNQLPGLVASHGANPVTLSRPSLAEARQMFAQRLAQQRVDAEPQAVNDIIAGCARLPLALAVAGAHAALDPALPLADLAVRLADSAGTLDPFDGADPATNIRAVFSSSYHSLSEPTARLFRLLGLCAGPDIALPAAASVAGLPEHQTRSLLAELTRAHLLHPTGPGRFGFHDLLRAYAIEQARQRDTDEQRAAARHRFLDHHLHTAHAATLLVKPGRAAIELAAPAPGTTPQSLAEHAAALAWFAAERMVLLATMARQPDGHDHHTWQLAWALLPFLSTRGNSRDSVAVQQAGLRAARRLGDGTAQAYAHRSLGYVYVELGMLTEAQHHVQTAMHLFEQLDDALATADSHTNLCRIADRRGDVSLALTHAIQAHHAYRTLGHAVGQAYAANNIGWCYRQLGNDHEGVAYCQQALDILIETDDLEATAIAWDNLGSLHFALNDAQHGTHCYQQAIGLYRRLGDRYTEADTHANLSEAHHRHGNHDAARLARRQALAVLDDLDPVAAAPVRARLQAVPG